MLHTIFLFAAHTTVRSQEVLAISGTLVHVPAGTGKVRAFGAISYEESVIEVPWKVGCNRSGWKRV